MQGKNTNQLDVKKQLIYNISSDDASESFDE